MIIRTHHANAPRPVAVRCLRACALAVSAAFVAACSTSAPPPVPKSSGAAGGAASVGGDESLQTCAQTVGTVRLQDGNVSARTAGSDTPGNPTLESLRGLLRDVDSMQQRNNNQNAGVTIESLRLLIQQSNCLAIVERGVGEEAATDEKRRARSGANEVRADAHMEAGQEVGADFVLKSMVLAINNNESSSGVSLGAFVPWKALGSFGSNKSSSSADVQLVLFDVRSKVQLAVAQGHGTGENTSMASNVLGRAGGLLGNVKVGDQTTTSTAKILLQAYADAYNKLVPALTKYKAQSVNGGLGAGGTLHVQGARATAGTTAQP